MKTIVLNHEFDLTPSLVNHDGLILNWNRKDSIAEKDFIVGIVLELLMIKKFSSDSLSDIQVQLMIQKSIMSHG